MLGGLGCTRPFEPKEKLDIVMRGSRPYLMAGWPLKPNPSFSVPVTKTNYSVFQFPFLQNGGDKNST